MRKDKRTKIKEIIEQIEKYESAADVLTNYDVRYNISIWSGHNGNTKHPITVNIAADGIGITDLKEMIRVKLLSLNEDLKELIKGESK